MSGCGATPPQAPLPDAKLLDRGTGGIALTCGLSLQIRAFPGVAPAELAALRAKAAMHAHEILTVRSRNPGWVYQGETVAQIAIDARQALHDCGLAASAGGL